MLLWLEKIVVEYLVEVRRAKDFGPMVPQTQEVLDDATEEACAICFVSATGLVNGPTVQDAVLDASVPFPNSSSITRLLDVARRSAEETCLRSVAKALCMLDTVSRVAILVKILSVIPMVALSAGMKLPT